MSLFPDKAAEYTFVLDGKERLSAIHDKAGDVLYLWRGEKAKPAVSIESQEGHLARIDPDTGELVGFTIFGWDGELRERGKFTVTVTAVRQDAKIHSQEEHKLELASA